MIADQRYEGIGQDLRAVLPKKKSKRDFLPVADPIHNEKVAIDRISKKNYFSRLCSEFCSF